MSQERRRAPRRKMLWESSIVTEEGVAIARCMVADVSATGAMIITEAPQDVPDCFVLALSKNGSVRRLCEVTWRTSRSLGARFLTNEAIEPPSETFISDMLARISSN
jgi:hypothetical protein